MTYPHKDESLIIELYFFEVMQKRILTTKKALTKRKFNDPPFFPKVLFDKKNRDILNVIVFSFDKSADFVDHEEFLELTITQ